jgi:hypothetical protein
LESEVFESGHSFHVVEFDFYLFLSSVPLHEQKEDEKRIIFVFLAVQRKSQYLVKLPLQSSLF